jgi:hypothetical protein
MGEFCVISLMKNASELGGRNPISGKMPERSNKTFWNNDIVEKLLFRAFPP